MAAHSFSSFSNLIDCPVLGYSIWDRHFFEQENYSEVIPAPEPVNDPPLPIFPTDTKQSHNGIQSCCDYTIVESSAVGEVTSKRSSSSSSGGRRKRPVPLTLSKETISKYFHLPINRAAEELGIGETALTRRCRKVGIPRWPYRKLKSLETLMKNVQDYEEDPKDTLARATVSVLKNKHKLLSELPGSGWDPEILCLRNAYFRLNSTKRKLQKMAHPPSPSPCNLATSVCQQEAEETDRVTSESTSLEQIPMDCVYLKSAVNLSVLAGVGCLPIPTVSSVTGEVEN